MTKRYLLIIKNKYLTTYSFYTFEEAKLKTSKNEINTIWEKSDEDIKKAIDEVVNNPLWNKLFKNLSKND